MAYKNKAVPKPRTRLQKQHRKI